jgi:hypothetical protein
MKGIINVFVFQKLRDCVNRVHDLNEKNENDLNRAIRCFAVVFYQIVNQRKEYPFAERRPPRYQILFWDSPIENRDQDF